MAKEDTPKVTKTNKVLVAANFGLMVDPTDSAHYTQEPKLVDKITNWMKVQIDAGKMTVVE